MGMGIGMGKACPMYGQGDSREGIGGMETEEVVLGGD